MKTNNQIFSFFFNDDEPPGCRCALPGLDGRAHRWKRCLKSRIYPNWFLEIGFHFWHFELRAANEDLSEACCCWNFHHCGRQVIIISIVVMMMRRMMRRRRRNKMVMMMMMRECKVVPPTSVTAAQRWCAVYFASNLSRTTKIIRMITIARLSVSQITCQIATICMSPSYMG